MDIVVVRVLIEDSRKKRRFNGTAFFINSNTLVTAKHVVDKFMSSDYKIYLSEIPDGGNLYVPYDLIKLCKRDIAVINLEKKFEIPDLPFSKNIKLGADVELIGYHNEDGTINHYKKSISGYINNQHTYEIQDDRTGGLSGSPVLLNGNLCGIAQAINIKKKVTYIIPITECCCEKSMPPKDTKNPYKGLDSFSSDDRYNFYGREKESQEIADSLKEARLFTLLGASGSGKSSLIFAGVIPLIKNDDVEILDFRLHDEPFKNLSNIFIPTLYPDKLEQIEQIDRLTTKLINNDIKLNNLVESFLKSSKTKYLYIIIDQFEELFTMNKNPNSFLAQLLRVVESELPVTLFISMRADFFSHISYYNSFHRAYVNNPSILLSLIDRENLHRVIEKPAQNLGVEFQDGLVDKIIDEIESEAGQLPILEFALEQLWSRKIGRVITFEVLNEIGGVTHAISNRSDEIYEDKNNEYKNKYKIDEEVDYQESIKKVFLKLVSPVKKNKDIDNTYDTRRVASFNEFNKSEKKTIKMLSDERLIVTRDNRVDIIHEALIREWRILGDWIREYRDFLEWEKQLREDRRNYDKHRKKKNDKNNLLVDDKLNDAERFLKNYRGYISEENVEFINRSKNVDDSKKRWTKIKLGLFFISLIVGIVWISFLYYKEKESNKNFFSLVDAIINGSENKSISQEELKQLIISKLKNSENKDMYKLLGNFYYIIGKSYQYSDKKNYKEALNSYEKALKYNYDGSDIFYDRGNLYYQQKEYDRAINDYKEVVQINPEEYYKAYYSIGEVYRKSEKYDLAVYYYQKIIDKNPKHGVIYSKIGDIYYFKIKNFQKAEDIFMKVIRNFSYNTIKYYKPIFELELLQGKLFNAKLEANFIKTYNDEDGKSNFIYYEFLKILQDISRGKDSNIDNWKSKYKDTPLYNFDINDILHEWIYTFKDKKIKKKLLEASEVFEKHKSEW